MGSRTVTYLHQGQVTCHVLTFNHVVTDVIRGPPVKMAQNCLTILGNEQNDTESIHSGLIISEPDMIAPSLGSTVREHNERAVQPLTSKLRPKLM